MQAPNDPRKGDCPCTFDDAQDALDLRNTDDTQWILTDGTQYAVCREPGPALFARHTLDDDDPPPERRPADCPGRKRRQAPPPAKDWVPA